MSRSPPTKNDSILLPLTIAEIQLVRHHLARCDSAQCDVLRAKFDEALDVINLVPRKEVAGVSQPIVWCCPFCQRKKAA